jgi:hypothetical protein
MHGGVTSIGEGGGVGVGTVGTVILDHHRYGSVPYHHHHHGYDATAGDGLDLDKGMAMEMGLLKPSSKNQLKPDEVQVTQTMMTIGSETTAVPSPVMTRGASAARGPAIAGGGKYEDEGDGGNDKAIEAAEEAEEEEEAEEGEGESGENVRNEPLRFKRPPGTEDVDLEGV